MTGADRPKPNETTRYLARAVDPRMVAVIEQHLVDHPVVVDVACGRGQYGASLRAVATTVVGIDADPLLCAAARDNGNYDRVVCADVAAIADHVPDGADGLFCSEFLEHLPNDRLRSVLDRLEAVAHRTIVVTVPHPRSPHFRHDPTHVLRYTVRSLHAALNERDRFRYERLPLGFAAAELARLPPLRLLQPISRRVAMLSPTVLYLGHRRDR